MSKLTVEELRKLRKQKKAEISRHGTTNGQTRIIVGMGTSGIASGARETFNTFLEELSGEEPGTILVKQTGSLGLDHAEPTVEILMPDMPRVIYGRVDAATARKIVRKHILGRILLNEHIYDMPAADIIDEEPATDAGGES
jgi:NADP-reducing hydrogenase subunit HndB